MSDIQAENLVSYSVKCFLLSKNILDLDAILYLSSKCYIDYLDFLYSNMPFDEAILKAIALKDLKGCKHILKKYNKSYPLDLYQNMNQETQILRAAALQDLDGIKFIYPNNYTNVYSNFEKDSYAVDFAIRLGDSLWISDRVFVTDINLEDLKALIKFAYYKEQLDIATILIHTSVRSHNVSRDEILNVIRASLIRTNPNVSYTGYLNHLEFLNYIFPTVDFKSVIDSMFTRVSENLLPSNQIFSDSISKISTLISKHMNHWLINSTINFFRTNNLQSNHVSFVLPQEGYAVFFPKNIQNLYKDFIITVPLHLPYILQRLLHEMQHALIYIILKNKGLPYSANNAVQYSQYKTSTNHSLTNFLLFLTNGKHNTYNNDVYYLLLLNHWYFRQNDNTLTETIFYKLTKRKESISAMKKKLLQLYKTNNFSDDLAYIADRIFDYLSQETDKQLLEFIPRLIEVVVSTDNTKIIELFEPSFIYFKTYILPHVNDYILNHFRECSNQFSNETLDLLNDIPIEILKTILHDAVRFKCKTLLQYMIDQKILNKIDYESKLQMLHEETEKIGPCVKYCITDTNCQDITPPSWQNQLYSIINYCTILKPEDTYADSKYQDIVMIAQSLLLSYDNVLLGREDLSYNHDEQ